VDDLRYDVVEACVGMAELRDLAYNHDKMLHALCKQSKINVADLNLRTPASIQIIDETDTGVGTPPASSVHSTLSNSPSLHLDRMTMESPTPQIMGPPIAGPSGRWPQAQGMLSVLDHMISAFHI
jgi:hypothetical protein